MGVSIIFYERLYNDSYPDVSIDRYISIRILEPRPYLTPDTYLILAENSDRKL